MDEVAEATAHAALAAVQAAARFPKVGDGRQLAVDGARRVPAAVEGVAGVLRRILVFEARVHVADQILAGEVSHKYRTRAEGREREQGKGELTIIVVVAYHHLLGLAILAHFAPKVLVEGVEMILQLRGIHLVLGIVGRVLVEVGEKDGL